MYDRTKSCKVCSVVGTDFCEACSGWLDFKDVEWRISNRDGRIELDFWDRRVCWDQGINFEFDNYQACLFFIERLQEDWQEYNDVMNKTVDEDLDFEDDGAINDWFWDRLEEVS